MLIIPYHVDVPMQRWPIVNFLLIAATVYIHFWVQNGVASGTISPESVRPYILQTGSPHGLYGHMFLHGGYMHLFGNMVFLWVFGNAVCAKVGNLAYLILYLGIGVVAGLTHLFVTGAPAVGASGAVNGVVGMYLVLYPRNNVSCFYWFIFLVGRFHLSSIWMILLWVAFDVYGASSGSGGVAYWAHLGGFGTGFGLATLLLYLGWIEMRSTECSLFEWLAD